MENIIEKIALNELIGMVTEVLKNQQLILERLEDTPILSQQTSELQDKQVQS